VAEQRVDLVDPADEPCPEPTEPPAFGGVTSQRVLGHHDADGSRLLGRCGDRLAPEQLRPGSMSYDLRLDAVIDQAWDAQQVAA
jgi:hypothetical protein